MYSAGTCVIRSCSPLRNASQRGCGSLDDVDLDAVRSSAGAGPSASRDRLLDRVAFGRFLRVVVLAIPGFFSSTIRDERFHCVILNAFVPTGRSIAFSTPAASITSRATAHIRLQ
jgi:hypothetical protein